MGHAPHEQQSGHPPRRWIALALALFLGLATPLLGGCAKYKKLSQGGSMTDVVMYDVIGRDRPPKDYYELVRSSHQDCDFCYACGDDLFLVDKNVHAVQRLGQAQYGRLEGQAEVAELLVEVLLEDCSALARSSAAGSLTQMGLKLPQYPGPRVEDSGDGLMRNMKELDALHDSCGRRRPDTPGTRQRVVTLITQIGNYEFPSYVNTKNSIRFFYSRSYLIDECIPQIRQAIDTALTKRLDALIRAALTSAVEDPVPTVRSEVLKCLKALGERAAAPIVVQRLEIESNWIVRLEGAEYLGRVGTREGVKHLIRMLDDPNASVRHKARQGLTRIAGMDYGFRPESWRHWATQKDPSIEFEQPPGPDDFDPSMP